MRFRFWPNTLAVQLIIVTAAAVALSNIAVAAWFEYGNELQTATAANERVLDRAASVATTLSAIPLSARATVFNSMSGRLWKFVEAPVPAKPLEMTNDEQILARHLGEMLPDKLPNKHLISVQINRPLDGFSSDELPPHSDASTQAVHALVPIDEHTMLSGVFVRAPSPWPLEIFVAAVVAILVASLGAALVARRVVQPLSELTKAAATVALGTHTPHVNEEGPVDVRNAAIAFNAMAEKVTRTLESQRHLLSAVGHDLRTPLTAMRINLEFVEDDELRDGLMRNLEELQALTEQVLASAKGTGGEQPRQVDLVNLVESLCTDLDETGRTGQLGQPFTCPHLLPAQRDQAGGPQPGGKCGWSMATRPKCGSATPATAMTCWWKTKVPAFPKATASGCLSLSSVWKDRATAPRVAPGWGLPWSRRSPRAMAARSIWRAVRAGACAPGCACPGWRPAPSFWRPHSPLLLRRRARMQPRLLTVPWQRLN